MSSRRSFLKSSLATAGLVGLASAAHPAQAESTLPPAIAAIPSYTGRIAPFTNAERLARIARARQLMALHQMDAIVLSNSTASSRYFANLRLDGWERMWALVIPAKAAPFLICPHFEEGRAHEELADGPFAKDASIYTWEEDQSPFALLASALRERGISTGTIGLDEQMKWAFAHGIAQAAPQLKCVSATPITAGCRMIKEQHELDCIRLAGEATLAVYRAVCLSLTPGMKTDDVERLIHQAYQRTGLRGYASINIDEFTALPHGSRQPQTLREGSILLLDDGCEIEGYTSDLTRTYVLGKPTDKMRRVFDVVHQAQSAARTTARPGVPAAEVDRAARKVVEDAGFGPGFKYFTHRLGHGIGMDMHEWPYFVANNMAGDDPKPALAAGMVLTAEPGIYIPGEFGIRLEDELHITPNGAEFLTPISSSIDEPFGRS